MANSVKKYLFDVKAKFDSKHHANAPDLSDNLVLLLKSGEPFFKVHAHLCSIINQFIIGQSLYCGSASSTSYGASAKGRRMLAKLHGVHYLLLGKNKSHGYSTSYALRKTHNIWSCIPVLTCPHFAGSPKARLYLIKY